MNSTSGKEPRTAPWWPVAGLGLLALSGISPDTSGAEAPRKVLVELATATASPGTDALHRQKQQALLGLAGTNLLLGRDYPHLPLLSLEARSVGDVDALRGQAGVRGVYENRAYLPLLKESLPLIRQPVAAALGFGGRGTTVAVVDTGVDYYRDYFGACVVPGRPAGCKVVAARDFTARDDGSTDDMGHGTSVAAIVLGVAPEARIAALDVFGPDGSATTEDLLDAIEWAVTHREDYNIVAINLSLGDGQRNTAPIISGPEKAAIDAARAAGILAIVAAGNESYTDGLSAPAAVDTAVSVGAVYDYDGGGPVSCGPAPVRDRVACFSNSAPFLSLLAPGSIIDIDGITFGGFQGTSAAAPFVAGAVAALRAGFPGEGVDQTLARLKNGAPVEDLRNLVTTPRLDLAAAVGDGVSPPPGPGPTPVPGPDPAVSQRISARALWPSTEHSVAFALYNAGDQAATGLRLRETLPEGVTVLGYEFCDASGDCDYGKAHCVLNETVLECQVTELAAGATMKGTLKARGNQAGLFTYALEIASEGADTNSDNDRDSTPLRIAGGADLAVNPGASGPSGLSFRLNNLGPDPAHRVRLDVALSAPAEWFGVPAECLMLGQTLTCHYPEIAAGGGVSVTLGLAAREGRTLSVSLRGEAVEPDPHPANDRADIELVGGTSTTRPGQIDLHLGLVAPRRVAVGKDWRYRANVRNVGPDPATGVVYTQSIPADLAVVSLPPECAWSLTERSLRCDLGSLPSLSRRALNFRMRARSPGRWTQVAEVSGREWDRNAGDNRRSVAGVASASGAE